MIADTSRLREHSYSQAYGAKTRLRILERHSLFFGHRRGRCGWLYTGCLLLSVRLPAIQVYSSTNAFTTAFLRLNVPDPLLCLTVSATLREKPLRLTRPTHPLAVYLTSIGSQILNDPASPLSPNGPPGEQMIQQTFEGLEEGNLLEGLRAGVCHLIGLTIC